jgi:glutathione S-transferase
VLTLLDAHLASRTFFVGERYSVADIAIYGYVHLAHESGYDMDAYPSIGRWLERVRAQAGYVNDVEPYPENARAGGGSSIYG